jgi:protein involved in polysaccharide export with SLBB domain
LQTRLFKLPGTQATVCGLLTNETSAGGHLPALLATAAASRGQSVILISHGPALAVSAPLSEMIRTPEQVVAHLTRTPQQVLHLTLDEFWTWSPEQRQEWNRALDRWSQVRGTVILVQLSSPKEAETLLVAEQLPNLMWIDRGSTTPPDSLQNLLENYHAAGCRFVGAMLNEAHNFGFRPLNKLALTTLALLFSWVAAVPAQSDVLTLGPGDAVNISVPGRPEYARNQVAVGPDGCLTYLQAQNLRAAGLSIDQLRSKLMMELRRYHKNLIVVVTPMTFQSRKVYVLGKVVKTGAINLDRPMTVLETIAEAGGLETGLSQQNTVELADLGRSFLMRGKARVDVDMEALFYKGDMTQNVLVQPDDYLYFPSSSSNEIYVLGNVKRQGTQGLLANTSVHSSIAQAGGFTPRAYTQRVLVVRGSFDNPQTFTVDMAAMLEGREKGFRLEPKDIVFVADKPWARAEELLSFALNAFTQGAISGWVGVNTVPLIQEAILPSIQ